MAITAVIVAVTGCDSKHVEPTPAPVAQPSASAAVSTLASAKASVPTAPEPAPLVARAALQGRILFVSERDGNREIYVVDGLIGSAPRRLTKSPDADYIAPNVFGAPGGALRPLLTVRADLEEGPTHQETLLWLTGEKWEKAAPIGKPASKIRNPSWDPAGKWFVYESNEASFRDLYRVDVATRTVSRLTDDQHGNFEPAVSPDGEHIAFASSRDQNAEVYVMKQDGKEQERLTNRPGDDSTPQWLSPSELLYQAQLGGQKMRIFHKDLHTGATRQMRPEEKRLPYLEQEVAVPAAGGHVALIVNRRESSNLVVIDGKTGRDLCRHKGVWVDQSPAWSPNGTALVFASNRTGDTELMVLHLEGCRVSRLTTSPGADWLPRWIN